MTPRRFFTFSVISLFLYLGVYTWNQRTGALDDLAVNVGLEAGGAILSSLSRTRGAVADFWEKYFDLVDVREENERLKAELEKLNGHILRMGEDKAELVRLRALLSMPPDEQWRPLGARVVAGRLGPNSVLETITINRGYLGGGAPGIPLATHMGLVGRVLRASAHSATVLLIIDPGSRIAIIGQDSRTPGILTGKGLRHPMEAHFMVRNSEVKEGELLITSGLDGVYPKGIPVARVTSVAPSDYTQFLAVMAQPIVDVERLEEVLLLEKRNPAADVYTTEPEVSPSQPSRQDSPAP